MKLEKLLSELHKLKLQPTDLYLLALRQILLNHTELLRAAGPVVGKSGVGSWAYQYANESKRLADRIGEFIENKQ